MTSQKEGSMILKEIISKCSGMNIYEKRQGLSREIMTHSGLKVQL